MCVCVFYCPLRAVYCRIPYIQTPGIESRRRRTSHISHTHIRQEREQVWIQLPFDQMRGAVVLYYIERGKYFSFKEFEQMWMATKTLLFFMACPKRFFLKIYVAPLSRVKQCLVFSPRRSGLIFFLQLILERPRYFRNNCPLKIRNQIFLS